MRYGLFAFAVASIVLGALTLSDGVLGALDGRALFLSHLAVALRLAGGLAVIVLGSSLLSRNDLARG